MKYHVMVLKIIIYTLTPRISLLAYPCPTTPPSRSGYPLTHYAHCQANALLTVALFTWPECQRRKKLNQAGPKSHQLHRSWRPFYLEIFNIINQGALRTLTSRNGGPLHMLDFALPVLLKAV